MTISKPNGANYKKNIKLPKAIVFKLVIIFILSNIFTFLIVCEIFIPETANQHLDKSLVLRPGYTDLTVDVEIKTSLEENVSYALTNKKKTIYIPHVFYLTTVSNKAESYFDENQLKSTLMLSVPKKYISKIIRGKHLELYPLVEKNQLITKSQKEVTYEINF